MTVFPEFHYTRKERIESALGGSGFTLGVLAIVTLVVALIQFLFHLGNEGTLRAIFELLVLPITVPATIAASAIDGNVGPFGLGVAAGGISLFFYSVLIYLITIHWWWKPISGKELAYLLWRTGRAIGFTLFVWVIALYSIDFWMELFVARHPAELAEITNHGTRTFTFSMILTMLAVLAIIGWFFITFKELFLQVEGSYYRRALGIIFGVQLIGGLGNLSVFWNGPIEQDFFMTAVGFIGAVGLLAWWNGCDQAYQMVKALKEQTSEGEKFSISMPEIKIPIPERTTCSLKGMGISAGVVTFVVFVTLLVMFLVGESSTEAVSTTSEPDIAEGSENYFAWIISSAGWLISTLVWPLRLLFELGFSFGQVSGLPMPLEKNTAGWVLGILFASTGLGFYVASIGVIFADKGNHGSVLLKILKFWSISCVTLGLVIATTAYLDTLWVASFLILHSSGTVDPFFLGFYSVLTLLVTVYATTVWWGVTCPEKYQSYWTLFTHATAMPFVTLFLALMTTQTTGGWSTWFMFCLALTIIAFVLGYIYSNGTPSMFQEEEQNDTVQDKISPEGQPVTT